MASAEVDAVMHTVIASTVGAGSVTPTLPTHEVDDVLLCITSCRLTTETCAAPSGWTDIRGIPTDTTNWRSYVFFKYATSSSESNPVCPWTATVCDKYAICHRLRNAHIGGINPFPGREYTAGTANPPVATEAGSSTLDELVLSVGLAGSQAVSLDSVVGTDPASLTTVACTATTGGTGGATAWLARAEKYFPAGGTGNYTHTFNTPVSPWFILIALALPAAPPQLAQSIQVPSWDSGWGK